MYKATHDKPRRPTKVVDFRAGEGGDGSRSVAQEPVGTPLYLAPEVVSGWMRH